MTVGICVYDQPPEELVDLGVAADELGFDALWIGEHIVAPIAPASAHPTSSSTAYGQLSKPIVDPTVRLVDPWVALSAVAARTERIRLGTAIYLLPLRHPLLTARAGASLAQLSGERFLLGIGVGWLEEEFEALATPFARRGRNTDEILDVLKRAWSGGPVEHQGAEWKFGPVQVVADPLRIPIVVGGNSPPAYRRACRAGDAWFASGTPSLEEALRLHDALRAEQARSGRSRALPAYVRMKDVDPDLLPRYEAAGIDNVVLWGHEIWTGASPGEKERSLVRTADRFGLTPKKDSNE